MATVANTTEHGERIACHCLRVTERELREAAATGQIGCLKSTIERTGAGSGCTACHQAICEILTDQSPSSPICIAK